MKKNIKILMLIFMILLVFLIILVTVLNSQKQDVEIQNDEQIHEETIEKYFSDKIMPHNVSSLYGNYKGSNDKNDLYESLNVLVNYIPQLSSSIKNIEGSNIEKYFEANFSNIKGCFGISELEEFEELVQKLKDKEININNYQYCEIVKDSYENGNDYLMFDLDVLYGNEILSFKTYFANKNVTKPEIKFIIK